MRQLTCQCRKLRNALIINQIYLTVVQFLYRASANDLKSDFIKLIYSNSKL
jgi:hypothetical protein